jgi:hypothetical protein
MGLYMFVIKVSTFAFEHSSLIDETETFKIDLPD